MKHKGIPWIVQDALPDQRKPLARRSTDDNVYRDILKTGSLADFLSANRSHIAANGGASEKIYLVGCRVNGVEFNRSRDIKSCLFKPKRQSTNSRKEVDYDWSVLSH